ncbi:hypothetical protein DSECCO2_504160 [anaerobic digester metagenome]
MFTPVVLAQNMADGFLRSWISLQKMETRKITVAFSWPTRLVQTWYLKALL